MIDLLSGTVTFLFTDIEDSTRLLLDLGQDTFARSLAEHDALIDGAIAKAGGVNVRSHGGGAHFAAFSTAAAAVDASIEAQTLLQHHAWPEGTDFRVRMGMHTGTGTLGGDGYIGIDVHRAARIASAGYGGQVLLSAATASTVAPNLPEGVQILDLGHHRLKDLDPEPLHQLQIVGLTSEFPPLKSLGTHTTNLPVIATSFVGRDQELADVRRLISGSRLVTLTGVGGAGKTRLALEAATIVSAEFPDGVWFVELSTVTDPDLVVTETAYALGIQEQQREAVRDTLLGHLARKTALLVIDNCEHVISAAAEMVNEVLSAAPDCKILATSRELLRVGGEIAYRLSAMSLPGDASGLTPLELGEFDAVRLFVERAITIEPEFNITTENAPSIAEICRRLDGLPLAIELAAAQLRRFSPQQIAGHLDRRFQVLTGGLQSAVPRQQTLAAAIDWSYQLLEDREQAMFERLAAFQGGFDLEAAQYVCVGDGLDTLDVFELVSALVDKSLLVADVSGGTARYRLLETLRQFARDKLEGAGAVDAVQRSHAEYFMRLAEKAEPNLFGHGEKDWRDRMILELDNFHLAMEWSLEAGEPELGMRLAGAMWALLEEHVPLQCRCAMAEQV